jgi:hypothetical protein
MRKWIVAFLGGGLVLCTIGVFVWQASVRSTRDPGWGQGKLKASEIARKDQSRLLAEGRQKQQMGQSQETKR